MSAAAIAEIFIPAHRFRSSAPATDFSLQWMPGQHWCISGDTAAGKTFALKCIAGLIFCPEAIISFPSLEHACQQNGGYVSDKIAFVPQEVTLPAGYIEDLYYQRRFQSAEQDDIPGTLQVLQRVSSNTQIIEKVAEQMKLTDLLNQPFIQLSNGQTRRLMLAVALLRQPEILILDNPYAGLDQQARAEINTLLTSLTKSGLHIMMAAHEHELENAHFITHRSNIDTDSPHATLNAPSLATVTEKKQPDEANAEILAFHQVQIKYGKKEVFSALDWRVKTGERWIIKGPNGSGKSSLLSLIFADHPQAYANEIIWKGRKRGTGESIWDIKREIGYFSPELLRFYQQDILGADVIASGFQDIIGSRGTVTQEQLQRVGEISECLCIAHLTEKKFLLCSAGEQRLILLARALVKDPLLLIFDEPFQGLDLKWRAFLKNFFTRGLQGKTILLVTHDDAEIPEGFDKVLNLAEKSGKD